MLANKLVNQHSPFYPFYHPLCVYLYQQHTLYGQIYVDTPTHIFLHTFGLGLFFTGLGEAS